MKNSINVSDLSKYVGDMINYKGYSLRISEVVKTGMTVYEPNTGQTATLSLDTASEIIRLKHATL